MMIKIIFLLIAIIIIAVVKYFQLKKMRNVSRIPKNHLENGVKFPVKTNELIIKSREYWEEENAAVSTISMLDSLSDDNRNYSQRKKSISILIYEGEYNGKKIRFTSMPINKEETAIKAALMHIPELYIFIDPKNENNYYFDVELLM